AFYTPSLHDALPIFWVFSAAAHPAIILPYSIWPMMLPRLSGAMPHSASSPDTLMKATSGYSAATSVVSTSKSAEVVRISSAPWRSEEHTSELQSREK